MKHLHPYITATFLLSTLLGSGPIAQAAESTSFNLYSDFPNYAEQTVKTSDSYQLNEDGLTWHALPGQSANFMIVTAPPSVASSAASSAPASAAASDDTSGGTPSGGGRRSAASSSAGAAPLSAASRASTASSRKRAETPARPRSRPAALAVTPPILPLGESFAEEIQGKELFTFGPEFHGAAAACPAITVVRASKWPWLIILLLSVTILVLASLLYIKGAVPVAKAKPKKPLRKAKRKPRFSRYTLL